MKWYLGLLIIMLSADTGAQNYNVSLIPDSLLENANAVTRFEEKKITIYSASRAIIRHKRVITILNEAGSMYADYQGYYSKMTDLSDISGTLYSANGEKLKTVKRKDIADVSYSDGISLMQDGRIKHHNFNFRQYPYTVEYEDQVELKGIIAFSPWMPVRTQKFAVEESNFIVEVPADYKFRFKQLNYDAGTKKLENDKKLTYIWQVKNLKPVKFEVLQPFIKEIVPAVFVAPNQFSYGGFSGEMDTWLNFGKYQVELNKGRDKLPESIKQQVRAVTDGVTNTEEKVKKLYEYLQKNTRYVSVQLGIGGLQPFDASYVASNNYGDCKALSNYMTALLKEAGINGYYAIINAGRGEKFYLPDFPSDQTNHIVVAVPLERDTMWLECTSQTVAAGYMGSFTDDRYALLIKEDGGHLVKTPAYKKEHNRQVRNIKASINPDGSLNARVTSKYTGQQQDELHMTIHALSKEKVLENLKKELGFPTYDVTALNYIEHKDVIPSIDETYNLVVENYATVSGKRLFVAPNLLTKQSYKLENVPRKFDIVYDMAYQDYDTISLSIPDGYIVESLPKDVSISNQFGNYKIQYKVENGLINLYRWHERESARFPASFYPDLVNYTNEMYKADRNRIVFIKQ